MKQTISVPDDLWTAALDGSSSGPSELVQRALRALVDSRAPLGAPMASAPDPGKTDRYQIRFEAAVDALAEGLREVSDRGYRLGLELGGGLSPSDFDLLDDEPTACRALQYAFEEHGDSTMIADEDPAAFSAIFWLTVEEFLEGNPAELLGEPVDPVVGIVWSWRPDVAPDESEYRPQLSPTVAQAAIGALRDVRDEANRRLREIRESAS